MSLLFKEVRRKFFYEEPSSAISALVKQVRLKRTDSI